MKPKTLKQIEASVRQLENEYSQSLKDPTCVFETGPRILKSLHEVNLDFAWALSRMASDNYIRTIRTWE